MSLKQLVIDKDWTLFLDRDGVINVKRDHDYVKSIEEFIFIDGVQKSIRSLNQIFGKIIVVTNQQGIGKKIMTENDLNSIHQYMKSQLASNNAFINSIYYAPQLKSENSIFRKPNIGMGAMAKRDFPEIIFSKSILVGDSESDIEFGIHLGMKTVFLQNGRNMKTKADFIFENLKEFCFNLNANFNLN